MAKLISGTEISAAVKERVRLEAEALEKKGHKPGLAVVLVGGDPASGVYVKNKIKACEVCGIESFAHYLPESTSEKELLDLICELGNSQAVDGILVQLPLPEHISEEAVLQAIPPQKDVDAFHPVNVGHIVAGDPIFLPCTPAGVMEMLAQTGIEISGKECVVVGRSNIVGKPMALLLLAQNGTVTVCHSKTRDLKEVTLRADILVVAVGRPKMITGDMIKPGAVVIDVGMNRVDGKLCGDVDFQSAEPVAGWITPVPGGVGPMTIAMLMENTVKSAKSRMS